MSKVISIPTFVASVGLDFVKEKENGGKQISFYSLRILYTTIRAFVYFGETLKVKNDFYEHKNNGYNDNGYFYVS